MNKDLRTELMYLMFKEHLQGTCAYIQINNEHQILTILKALDKLGFTYFENGEKLLDKNTIDDFYYIFKNKSTNITFIIFIEFYISYNGKWKMDDYCVGTTTAPIQVNLKKISYSKAMGYLKEVHKELHKNIKKFKEIC